MKKYGLLGSEGKYYYFCEGQIKRAYVLFPFLPLGVTYSHSLH